MLGFWTRVKFVMLVTTNRGGWEAAGMWSFASCAGCSPSCPNASLRMWSIRWVSDWRLATVKSHARYRLLRAIPACWRVRKIDSMWAARFVSPPGDGAEAVQAVQGWSRYSANTAGARRGG